MKTIITIVLILLVGSVLTSCDESTASVPPPPPPPNPVEVLEDQIESERQLRLEAEARVDKAELKVGKAEAKVEEAILGKGNWQILALSLAAIAVLGFFGGTAIGSRGRSHATATS